MRSVARAPAGSIYNDDCGGIKAHVHKGILAPFTVPCDIGHYLSEFAADEICVLRCLFCEYSIRRTVLESLLNLVKLW